MLLVCQLITVRGWVLHNNEPEEWSPIGLKLWKTKVHLRLAHLESQFLSWVIKNSILTQIIWVIDWIISIKKGFKSQIWLNMLNALQTLSRNKKNHVFPPLQILQCPSLLEVCIGLPGSGTCLDPNKQCDQLTFCCYNLAPPGAPCTTLQASQCQEIINVLLNSDLILILRN